jgi:hypothetical protein
MLGAWLADWWNHPGWTSRPPLRAIVRRILSPALAFCAGSRDSYPQVGCAVR